LDLGLSYFLYEVGLRTSGVVRVDDQLVDSTIIGVSSLIIPFLLPEATIRWLFFGVILQKPNTKHSIHNPYFSHLGQ